MLVLRDSRTLVSTIAALRFNSDWSPEDDSPLDYKKETRFHVQAALFTNTSDDFRLIVNFLNTSLGGRFLSCGVAPAGCTLTKRKKKSAKLTE